MENKNHKSIPNGGFEVFLTQKPLLGAIKNSSLKGEIKDWGREGLLPREEGRVGRLAPTHTGMQA